MVVSVGSRTRYYDNGTSVTCLGIVCPLGKSTILIYPHGPTPWMGLGWVWVFITTFNNIQLTLIVSNSVGSNFRLSPELRCV